MLFNALFTSRYIIHGYLTLGLTGIPAESRHYGHLRRFNTFLLLLLVHLTFTACGPGLSPLSLTHQDENRPGREEGGLRAEGGGGFEGGGNGKSY